MGLKKPKVFRNKKKNSRVIQSRNSPGDNQKDPLQKVVQQYKKKKKGRRGKKKRSNSIPLSIGWSFYY
jgi:hypothetical protein